MPEWDIPEEGEYLWDMFQDIQKSCGRRVVQGEPLPLSVTDIANWMHLRRMELRPFEVKCLIAMSHSWAEAIEMEIENARSSEDA